MMTRWAPPTKVGRAIFSLKMTRCDDLGDEEAAEGDVDAHEAAEVPLGLVYEDAVGEEEEGAGGEGPPDVFVEAVADEGVAADFEDGGDEEQNDGDGTHEVAPLEVGVNAAVGRFPTARRRRGGFRASRRRG